MTEGDHLHQIVELKEDLHAYSKGEIGLCTADLPEVYAIWWAGRDAWVAFHDQPEVKSKFLVLGEWSEKAEVEAAFAGRYPPPIGDIDE